MDDIKERSDRVNIDAANHCGFFGIGFWDDHLGDFPPACFDGDGQGAANTADPAVERKLSPEKTVGNLFFGQAAIRT